MSWGNYDKITNNGATRAPDHSNGDGRTLGDKHISLCRGG